MHEIDRTLSMKRPATVIDTRPVLTMIAPYHRRADLVTAVTNGARRGQIRPLIPEPAYNNRTGHWEIRVVQLRPAAPAWIRPVFIAGFALTGLSLMIGLAWWVLASLTATPLALLLLAALGGLMALTRSGRSQTVNIKVVQK